MAQCKTSLLALRKLCDSVKCFIGSACLVRPRAMLVVSAVSTFTGGVNKSRGFYRHTSYTLFLSDSGNYAKCAVGSV